MTQACHRLPSAFRLARRAKIVSVTVLRVLTYAQRQSHLNEQSHCKENDKEQCRGEPLHYVAKVVCLCQVVKRFVGYSNSSWGLAVHVVLAILSGGLFEFTGHCYPQTKIWTMRQSPVSKAKYVWTEGLVI